MAAATASAMASSSTQPSSAPATAPSLPPIDTATPIVARDYGASPPASSKGKGIPLSRTKSISFHAPSHPSWVGRRKMPRTRTIGSIDSIDADSDTDSISTTSGDDDGRYRPRFLPGHLLSRLRRQQQEEQVDDRESASSVPASLHTYRRTPILSGCLAPFSIMLEVPGLTTKWYVRNGPNGTAIEYRRNPPILEVGLAISIFSAVVANICLILRFTSILRPRRGTALSIAGFVLHDAINIAALVAFGVIHAVDDGYSYSQAYWMTLAATAASLACTFTLLIDYAGTRDFKNAGSGLTTKQTQLVIVVMILLVYLSLGSLLYSLLLSIPFEAALYFTCTTTLAVGFGDIVPTTVAAKICLFFYAPLGIALFAVTIVIARGTILEEFENSYRRRREEFRSRLKERRRGQREIRREKKRARREAQQRKGMEGGSGGSLSRKSSILPWRRATSYEAKEAEDNVVDIPRSESPVTYEEPIALESMGGAKDSNGQDVATPTTPSPQDAADADATPSKDDPNDDLSTTLAAHQRELETGWTQFRSDLALREKTEFWTKLLVAFFLFVAFWLIGATVFMFTESWTFFTAFYFCYVLFTTIGFGDYVPRSDAGRSFFIVWSLAGVGVLTILISVVSDAWSSTVTDNLARTRRRLQEKGRRWRDRVVNRSSRRRRGRGGRDGAGDTDDAATDGDDEDGEGLDNSIALSDGDVSTDDGGMESRDSARATTTGAGILQQTSPAPALPGATITTTPAALEQAAVNQPTESNNVDEASSAHRLAESALRFHSAAIEHLRSHRAEMLGALRAVPGFRDALPRHLFPGGTENEDEQSTSPLSPRQHHHHLLPFFGARRGDDGEQEAEEQRQHDDVDSATSTALDLAPLRQLVSSLESFLQRPRQPHASRHEHGQNEEDEAATHAALSHTTRLLAFLELEQATRDVLRDVAGLEGKMRGLREENARLRKEAAAATAAGSTQEKAAASSEAEDLRAASATTIPGDDD